MSDNHNTYNFPGVLSIVISIWVLSHLSTVWGILNLLAAKIIKLLQHHNPAPGKPIEIVYTDSLPDERLREEVEKMLRDALLDDGFDVVQHEVIERTVEYLVEKLVRLINREKE